MEARKQGDSPNVLFFICDDLNNALSGMGRVPFAPAPNIARIARRGAAFVNAQSNCPICMPSRNSLYSGLYPHTTGSFTLWDRRETITPIATTAFGGLKNHGRQLLSESVMMPAHFKANGYTALGCGKTLHNGRTDPRWWNEYDGGPDYGPKLADNEITDAQRRMYQDEPLASYVERYRGIDRFFLSDGEFRHHVETAFGSLEDLCRTGKRVVHAPGGADGDTFRFESDEDRDPLPDERSAQWAIAQLRKPHDRPFFLNVGFMKPHTPLNVPQTYFDRFPLDSIELPPFFENDLEDCARALIEHRPYGFLMYGLVMKGGVEMWRRWLQAYLACVAFVDDQVGKVLDALDASPYADDTIVVFTSDNGYHMGEKEYIFKDSLWEEGSQVPLVVGLPGGVRGGGSGAGNAGGRGPSGRGEGGAGGSGAAQVPTCTRAVSLIDVYPTLVDLCDIPEEPHEATHQWPLQGHSLRPLIEEPHEGRWTGPPVALSSVRGDTGIHHSVRSDRYRYTLCNNGEEELYDHHSDPHEWRNLAADAGYSDVKQELRQELLDLVFGKSVRGD
jgi:iduronate 2-sulfatase